MDQQTQPKKHLKKPTLRMILIWVLTATVVLVSGAIVLSRMIAYARIQNTIEEKKAEIAKRREQIEELEYWLDAPVDYDYIIKVAREEIGLHFPDEDIYYTDDSDSQDK